MLLYLTFYGWCCTSFILPRILLFNPYMHKTLPLLPESSLQPYHKPSRMAHVQTRVQHLASVRNN